MLSEILFTRHCIITRNIGKVMSFAYIMYYYQNAILYYCVQCTMFMYNLFNTQAPACVTNNIVHQKVLKNL